MRETYAVIERRRGPRTARVTAAINVAGAAGRVAWMTPPALLSSRWRTRRRETMAWMAAHREGLRRASAQGAEP